MDQLRGVVKSLVNGDEALIGLDDGSERRLQVPGMIYVEVGMPVRIVDFGDGAPIIGWGT